MLRADYCGDGTSHTENETQINFFDDLGIRYDDLDWNFEAEWDEYGAICANQERITGTVPQCMSDLYDEDCGNLSHFADGALIMSEVSF